MLYKKPDDFTITAESIEWMTQKPDEIIITVESLTMASHYFNVDLTGYVEQMRISMSKLRTIRVRGGMPPPSRIKSLI